MTSVIPTREGLSAWWGWKEFRKVPKLGIICTFDSGSTIRLNSDVIKMYLVFREARFLGSPNKFLFVSFFIRIHDSYNCSR